MKKKRAKPRMHVRNLRTSNGITPTVINKNIRPNKRRAHLRPAERKVINFMSKHPRFDEEFGGSIDFNKKGEIERLVLVPGKKGYVDLEELDDDFEVMFHTHPAKINLPPSPEDVGTFLRNKDQQAELVIAKDDTFIVSKNDRMIKPKSYKALDADLKEYYDSVAGSSKNWINDWLTYVKDVTGLDVKRVKHSKKKPLHLPITPVEPELVKIKPKVKKKPKKRGGK